MPQPTFWHPQVEDAERSLDALAEMSLLDADGREGYRFHDLVRLYAAELATEHDSDQDRQAAIGRVLEFYQSNALWADKLLRPKRVQWAPFTPVPMLTTEEHTEALWSTASELDNLVAMIRYGAEKELGSLVWRLALALGGFTYYMGGTAWTIMRDCCRLALEAASHAANQQARAQLLDELGELAARLTDWDDAITHWELAGAAWAELGDSTAEADCRFALTHMYLAVGSLEKASAAAERCAELRRGQPGERIVLVALGLISIDLRQWEQAIAPLERALSLADDEPDPGRVFFATGFGESDSHIMTRQSAYSRSVIGYFLPGDWCKAARAGRLLAYAMLGRPPVDAVE